MATSVKSRQESVNVKPTMFEISVDDMSVFSWSLYKRTSSLAEPVPKMLKGEGIPT